MNSTSFNCIQQALIRAVLQNQTDKQSNQHKTFKIHNQDPSFQYDGKKNLARDRAARSDSRVPIRDEIEVNDVDQSVVEYLVEMIHDKPSAVRAQSFVKKLQSDFTRCMNGRDMGNCGATEEEEQKEKRLTSRGHT